MALKKIAEDFDYASRYYSEKSIDAAKKLFPVDCYYLDGLTVKMLGREHGIDKFNVELIDLDKVAATTERKEDDKKVWNHNGFFDIFQEMRVSEIDELIGFVNRTVRTQVMPKSVLEYCDSVANANGKNKAAYRLITQIVMKMFMTVQTIRRKDMAAARSKTFSLLGGLSRRECENIADDVAKVVKAKYNETYKALTNMIRLVSKKCTPVERACIVMSAIYASKKDGQGKSGILRGLLPEEYALWVAEMANKFHEWEVIDRVETRIHVCEHRDEFTEFVKAAGVVKTEFEAGVAHIDMNGEDVAIYTMDANTDGVWFIDVNENGHVAAYRPVKDFVKIPETDNTVCFATSSIRNSVADANEILGDKGVKMLLANGVIGTLKNRALLDDRFVRTAAEALNESFAVGKHVHIRKDYVAVVDDVPACRINAYTNDKDSQIGSIFYAVGEKAKSGVGYNDGTIADVVISDYPDNNSPMSRGALAIVVMKDAHFEKPENAASVNCNLSVYRAIRDDLRNKLKEAMNHVQEPIVKTNARIKTAEVKAETVADHRQMAFYVPTRKTC